MRYLCAMLLSLFCLNSFALTLDEARCNGMVAEQPDGYVKAVDAKAKSLADDVNKKRKAAYEKIAKETGVDVATVAAQAAQKIKEKQATACK